MKATIRADQNDIVLNSTLVELSTPRLSILPERATVLVKHAADVCSVISRTFQGASDTTCSELKPKLAIVGEDLKASARQNFVDHLTQTLMFPPKLKDGEAVRHFIRETENALNAGIKKRNQPLFRTWITDQPNHVQPNEIPANVLMFSNHFAYYWNHDRTDPRKFSAWVEHDFNGRIHALGDGCTRFTIFVATLILGLRDLPYPDFKDRSDMTDHIAKPIEDWFAHYARAIEAARTKIGDTQPA